jgi:hypothetical protein
MRLGVNHIDKADFLAIFKQARIEALSHNNIQSGFAKAGLIPFDLERVLSQLQIRLHTPPVEVEAVAAAQSQVPLETPYNVAQLDQ